MSKNSTLKLLDLFLENECFNLDQSAYKKPILVDLQPREETVSKILAYSRSVRGIQIKLGDKFLISLN